MPYASYPGCELVHVHSVVCIADILQIHLPLAGTLRAILYPYHSLCLVCFAVCRHTSTHHSLDFRLYQNSGMLSAFFSSLLLTRNVLCTGSVCATLLFHTILVYGYACFMFQSFLDGSLCCFRTRLLSIFCCSSLMLTKESSLGA